MLEELEAALWQRPDDDGRLAAYQDAFRQLEQHNTAPRHHFIIVIPVADRPQHLEACLASTLTLCDSFGYGGREGGRYHKVELLIADDSREPNNIVRHREIAADYSRRGLTCHYFGQAEQLAQLTRLNAATRRQLAPIIGNTPAEAFYHKGASLMRNIAYLRLQEMVAGRDDTLIYFIDSDQEFQVKVASGDGERNLYAINYLYQLDRIFRDTDAAILTGKVVGDPPVSPAVMAGNFLDDVSAFLQECSTLGAGDGCSFHRPQPRHSDDAAYHDMAELFGFKKKADAFHYHCSLRGAHDHAACLADFARRLNRFFDGEHPTRNSYYEHLPLAGTITPARTIYTGNYCFRAAALRYFIPFATLKLRMAGPVLGRIIKAELGGRFVSANLPMLHKRTVEEIGQSEFRPGIERQAESVDLSGEYERQFFGDVMLFTMERLTAGGFPQQPVAATEVTTTVEAVEAEMLEKYRLKHAQVVDKVAALRTLFEAPQQWWHHDPALHIAVSEFRRFIANMEHNFGESARGYALINDAAHRAGRRETIIEAILHYCADRARWEALLA